MGKYRGRNARALVVALALLPACAIQRPPHVVDVPVTKQIYCDPGDVPEPMLPIASLKPETSPSDTMRAYASTVAILKGEIVRRDILLDSCRAPSYLVGPDQKTVQAVKDAEVGK